MATKKSAKKKTTKVTAPEPGVVGRTQVAVKSQNWALRSENVDASENFGTVDPVKRTPVYLRAA